MRLAGSAVGGVANWDRLKTSDPAGVRMLRGDSSFGDAPPCTQCPTQSEAHQGAHSLLDHECCVHSHCCQPSRAHHGVHRTCRTDHVHTALRSAVAVRTASTLTDRSGKELIPGQGTRLHLCHMISHSISTLHGRSHVCDEVGDLPEELWVDAGGCLQPSGATGGLAAGAARAAPWSWAFPPLPAHSQSCQTPLLAGTLTAAAAAVAAGLRKKGCC